MSIHRDHFWQAVVPFHWLRLHVVSFGLWILYTVYICYKWKRKSIFLNSISGKNNRIRTIKRRIKNKVAMLFMQPFVIFTCMRVTLIQALEMEISKFFKAKVGFRLLDNTISTFGTSSVTECAGRWKIFIRLDNSYNDVLTNNYDLNVP